MPLPYKFLLFAHARSGSSNLLRAMQLHPALRVAEEPFHEKYAQWNPGERRYIDLIHDEASLDEQVADLFGRFDGLKVLDYQLPMPLYRYLLLRDRLRIIYLERRNLLRTVVSRLVAGQTNVWNASDLKEDLDSTYAKLAPLDVAEVAEQFEYGLELRRYFRAVMAAKDPSHKVMLQYETLYSDDIGTNRAALARVLAFLGLDPVPPSPELDRLLDPRHSKLSGSSDYSYVPNAAAIDARFGSDETGWLLRSDA